MIIKLGERLGSGGFATVYRAVDPQNAQPLSVAVKKMRASQRIRRPHLLHELRVLLLLRGHPAIPHVVAYGHLKHFEYLAIELLGETLAERMPTAGGMLEMTVATIAMQMFSALDFIHLHGIVHRDIKPSNILVSLDQPPTLRLVDFGIARPTVRTSGLPIKHDPVAERHRTPGTLQWVGLNVLLGYDTYYRDDLESLAYTLLYLLRGSLPWERYAGGRAQGTVLGRQKHVREKKKQWSGRRLGEGFAREFGELLDYARALGIEDIPDYEMLRKRFEHLAATHLPVFDSPSITTAVTRSEEAGPPPVLYGQLVYVTFLSRITIEGYTAQASDTSHWVDTSLIGPEWEPKRRPAVVLEVEKVKGVRHWMVKVLPLRRRSQSDVDAAKGGPPVMEVSPQSSRANEQWPWPDTVAFGSPAADVFYSLYDQPVLTPAPWFLPASTCEALIAQFDKPLQCIPRTNEYFQLRRAIRARTTCILRAALFPLENPCIEAKSCEWYDPRGWLDDIAKAVRRHLSEDGQDWSLYERDYEPDESKDRDRPTDSNSDPWMTWWPQGGREASVTFSLENVDPSQQGQGRGVELELV